MGRYCFCRTKTFKRKYINIAKEENDIFAGNSLKTVPKVTFDDSEDNDVLGMFEQLDACDVIYAPDSPKKKSVQTEEQVEEEISCCCKKRTLMRNRDSIGEFNSVVRNRSKAFSRVNFDERKQKELLTKFRQLDVSDIKTSSLQMDGPVLKKRQLKSITSLEGILEPSSKRVIFDDSEDNDVLGMFEQLDACDVIYAPDSPKKKLVQTEEQVEEEISCCCKKRTLVRNRASIGEFNSVVRNRSKAFSRVIYDEKKQKELLTKFQQLDVSDIKSISFGKDFHVQKKHQLKSITSLEGILEPSSKRVKKDEEHQKEKMINFGCK